MITLRERQHSFVEALEEFASAAAKLEDRWNWITQDCQQESDYLDDSCGLIDTDLYGRIFHESFDEVVLQLADLRDRARAMEAEIERVLQASQRECGSQE